MAKLISAIHRELVSEEVVLGGETMVLHALRAAETEVLEGVYTRPAPPLRPDPRGDARTTPLIPDAQNHGYRRELEVWTRRYKCLEVAASAGLATEKWPEGFALGMPAEHVKLWADSVCAELKALLTDDELHAAWERVRELSEPLIGDKVELAKKALSALSPGERAAVVAEVLSSPTSTG